MSTPLVIFIGVPEFNWREPPASGLIRNVHRRRPAPRSKCRGGDSAESRGHSAVAVEAGGVVTANVSSIGASSKSFQYNCIEYPWITFPKPFSRSCTSWNVAIAAWIHWWWWMSPSHDPRAATTCIRMRTVRTWAAIMIKVSLPPRLRRRATNPGSSPPPVCAAVPSMHPNYLIATCPRPE